MNNKIEIWNKAVKDAARKLRINFSKAKNTCLNYTRAGLPVFALMGMCLIFSQAASAQGPIFTGDAGNL